MFPKKKPCPILLSSHLSESSHARALPSLDGLQGDGRRDGARRGDTCRETRPLGGAHVSLRIPGSAPRADACPPRGTRGGPPGPGLFSSLLSSGPGPGSCRCRAGFYRRPSKKKSKPFSACLCRPPDSGLFFCVRCGARTATREALLPWRENISPCVRHYGGTRVGAGGARAASLVGAERASRPYTYVASPTGGRLALGGGVIGSVQNSAVVMRFRSFLFARVDARRSA